MNRSLLAFFLLLGAGVLLMSTRWTIPTRGQPYARFFQAAEYTQGLPRFLLAKQAEQESNYDPAARSPAGAIGIMQIIPKWHPGVDPLDPAASISYAGKWMRELYDRFGSWQKALAAYNAGPTALQQRIDRHGVNWLANMPAETQSYVARITHDVQVA